MIVVNHPDGTTHIIPEDEVDAAELAGRADAIMRRTPPVYGFATHEFAAYHRGYAWGLRQQRATGAGEPMISDQLRRACRTNTASPYAIARYAGIDKSAMSRFMNGGRLTMEKLDRLANTLGMALTEPIAIPPLRQGRPKA